MWPGAGGGDDDDLFCEGRANMEQQGNEQQRFPTLVVAGSNNTPTEEFVKLPIKMLYLNVKLSHNELPSFPIGVALARKQKMYVERVILIFDLFATDAELDSFRQASGYKNRTSEHRAAVEVINAAVRLFFATLFSDVIGRVPPNLLKKAGGGAVPELKLSTIHTLLERLDREKSLKLHGANQREALREACLEFRNDNDTYKREDFVSAVVLQNKKQKVFGKPATVQEVDEAGDE